MGDNMNKQIEKFESDYDKIFAKGAWTKEDLEMMKDLQKLMYYLEVRCAMKKAEEGEYQGGEMSYDSRSYNGRSYDGRSYARSMPNRSPSTGRFVSSGHYPMDYSYDMSGRRYYDGEKENAVNELHRMMSNMTDPESKMALQDAIRNLEMK